MSWRDRLTDPWGALLATTAGGTAWAVLPGSALAIPIGLGVAVAVFGAKVAADAVLAPRRPAEPAVLNGPTPLPRPRPGTPARDLLDRAERALRTLDTTVESAAAGATREQLRAIRDEAAGTRAGIERLAGRTAAFSDALAAISVPTLRAERTRLISAIEASRSPEAAAERRAALDGVDEQLAAHERLAQAGEITLARLQATTLGLEGLVTRAVEVLAMAAGADHLPHDDRVDELAGELEALRLGIADVERHTRPALPPQAPEAG